MRKKHLSKLSLGLLTIFVLLVFLFPFFWMLLASFKTQAQIMSGSNMFIFTPTGKNYADVFQRYDFLRYMANSMIVAVASTLLSLLIGLPAAYSIAKFRMHKLSVIILIARIVPGISFLVPWYIIFSQMRLVDTFLSLTLSHMLVGLPFIVWVMISFFESLPYEVEEAALIDGCTPHQVFLRAALPISLPGIMTSSLLSFIFSWNNFMFSIILAGDKTKTLPIAVFNFMSYAEINWAV